VMSKAQTSIHSDDQLSPHLHENEFRRARPEPAPKINFGGIAAPAAPSRIAHHPDPLDDS
jgi:hypothetical protein